MKLRLNFTRALTADFTNSNPGVLSGLAAVLALAGLDNPKTAPSANQVKTVINATPVTDTADVVAASTTITVADTTNLVPGSSILSIATLLATYPYLPGELTIVSINSPTTFTVSQPIPITANAVTIIISTAIYGDTAISLIAGQAFKGIIAVDAQTGELLPISVLRTDSRVVMGIVEDDYVTSPSFPKLPERAFVNVATIIGNISQGTVAIPLENYSSLSANGVLVAPVSYVSADRNIVGNVALGGPPLSNNKFSYMADITEFPYAAVSGDGPSILGRALGVDNAPFLIPVFNSGVARMTSAFVSSFLVEIQAAQGGTGPRDIYFITCQTPVGGIDVRTVRATQDTAEYISGAVNPVDTNALHPWICVKAQVETNQIAGPGLAIAMDVDGDNADVITLYTQMGVSAPNTPSDVIPKVLSL
jgi:hypothetical protein